MKLILCQDCWDVFKLTTDELRQCKCGKVKGRYINNVEAEVSPGAISIGIGNGSLQSAIYDMLHHQAETKDTAPRDDYYKAGNGKITYAWVRPNFGPGNPHTKLMEEPTK